MKTFEEALHKIMEDQNHSVNMKQYGEEQFKSDEFLNIIDNLVDKWRNEIVKIPESDPDFALNCRALTCATFQALFNFGLLVGIEMEKQ